jgi:hypothetical protein
VSVTIDCCRAFFEWEFVIGSADPAVKPKRLGNALHGIAAWPVSDVNRLLDEIGRAEEDIQHSCPHPYGLFKWCDGSVDLARPGQLGMAYGILGAGQGSDDD